MEILYVLAIIAVFVLCIALLSTARKILRSSPLSSGQLGLARIHSPELSEVEDFDEMESLDQPLSRAKPLVRTEAGFVPSTEAAGDILWENELPVAIADSTVARQALPPAAAAPGVAALVSMPTAAACFDPPQFEPVAGASPASRWARFRKPSRRTYNYALECALLGVSAWVLIRTQRSMVRNRSLMASQNRVA